MNLWNDTFENKIKTVTINCTEAGTYFKEAYKYCNKFLTVALFPATVTLHLILHFGMPSLLSVVVSPAVDGGSSQQ